MLNLLEETIRKLARHGKKPGDVLWLGYRATSHYPKAPWHGTHFFWAEFAASADRDYEDQYETFEVYPGLIIVGEDWWLERDEENAQEWWVFKELPGKPVSRCKEVVVFTDEAERILDNED